MDKPLPPLPPCNKCGAPREIRPAVFTANIEIRKCPFTGVDLVDIKDLEKLLTRFPEYEKANRKSVTACNKCGAPHDIRGAIVKSYIEIRKCYLTGKELVELKEVDKMLMRCAAYSYRREKELDREWID